MFSYGFSLGLGFRRAFVPLKATDYNARTRGLEGSRPLQVRHERPNPKRQGRHEGPEVKTPEFSPGG